MPDKEILGRTDEIGIGAHRQSTSKIEGRLETRVPFSGRLWLPISRCDPTTDDRTSLYPHRVRVEDFFQRPKRQSDEQRIARRKMMLETQQPIRKRHLRPREKHTKKLLPNVCCAIPDVRFTLRQSQTPQ